MKKRDKNNKKKERFEITELFMARAGKKDWNHCFHGTICRFRDDEGKEIAVSGKIEIDKGMVWSAAENQEELGKRLDEFCTLIVFHGLDYNNRNVMYIGGNELNIN